MKALPGYTLIGPLAYRGKQGCESSICTRFIGQNEDGSHAISPDCIGWHCSYCDAPCSSQGHRCDAANAILGEAERIAKEEG